MSPEYKSPAVTVDGVIRFEDGAIVLIQRKNPPFQGLWALPGGFVEYGETVEQAVIREIKEETGLKVELGELIGVYSDPKRDPRGHTVGVAFMARPIGGKLKAGDDAGSSMKTDLFMEMKLAFDHDKIVRDARRKGLL